jgi:hypothetical protein
MVWLLRDCEQLTADEQWASSWEEHQLTMFESEDFHHPIEAEKKGCMYWVWIQKTKLLAMHDRSLQLCQLHFSKPMDS